MVKGIIGRFLPRRAVHVLKRIYYPFIVRSFTDNDWVYAPVLKALVKPADRIVDVGANIGYISILLARWVGEQGCVYAVEPVGETFDFLRHNVQKLGYRNIRLFHCAASSRDGVATMQIPAFPTGGDNFYQSHIVVDEGKDNTGFFVSVETKRLDDLLSESLDAITFIKIDVEGHELDTVRGARQVIERSEPVLLIEVSGDPDEEGASANFLFRLLHEQGYQSYLVQEFRLRQRREGDRAVDFLFLKQKHASILLSRGLL